MRFATPLEVKLDDKHSLLSHAARLKGGSPFATVSVFNGIPVHEGEFLIRNSNARSEFAKEVRSRTGVAEDVTEKALLLISNNLTTTYAAYLEAEQESEAKPNQATALVELATDRAEFFHDANGDAYATIQVQKHKETWRLRTKGFRNWLLQQYYEDTEGAANSQALQDALGILEANAWFKGPLLPVFLRVAEHNGAIFIDLCNDKWEAVEITATGWRVVADPPVKFKRTPGMLSLPYPVAGGSLDELRSFTNFSSENDWALFCSWLVQGVGPTGPYPVLVFHGEHGSAKSTIQAMARSLIDPNSSPLRTEPRNEHDLVIAASNGWCISLDNLSIMHGWLSDGICRLSTGGGLSTRQLYTDNEEVLFNVKRPVMINGIEELVTRPDLLDRSLNTNSRQIAEDRRRPEKEIWEEFNSAMPRILGALYDAVSCALRNLPATKLDRLPRLADFAMWAVAAESGLGLSKGTFLKAYSENKESANDLVLESSAVAKALLAFAEEETEWLGHATELLKELSDEVDEGTRRQKSWPGDGRALSNRLRRLAPNLRAAGMGIEFDVREGKRKRLIRIEWLGISASSASTASPGEENQGFTRDANNTGGRKPTEPEDANGNQTNPANLIETNDAHRQEDAKNAGDAKKQTNSENDGSEIDLDFAYCPTCGFEGPRFTDCPECEDEIR